MILPDWHREFDTMDTLGFNLYMRSTPTKVSTVSGPQVVIVAPPKIYEDEVRPYPDGPLPSLNYLAEPEYSPRRFSAIKEYPGSKFDIFVGTVIYGVPGFDNDEMNIPLGPNPGVLDEPGWKHDDATSGWDDEDISEPFKKFLSNQFLVSCKRTYPDTHWILQVSDWSGSTQEILDADYRSL